MASQLILTMIRENSL